MKLATNNTRIVKKLTPGQSAFMEALYHEYHDYLLRFLQRMDVEGMNINDIAQDAYYRLARTDKVEELEHPRAFLFKTATNLVNDFCRRNYRRHTDDHIDIGSVDLCSATSSPDRQVQGQQDIDVMRAVLGGLSPKCQTVIVMSKFQHRSHKDIARSLNISTSMVEKYIRQTTRKIKQRIEMAGEPRLTLVDMNNGH